jgi:DnaK suppressor protein
MTRRNGTLRPSFYDRLRVRLDEERSDLIRLIHRTEQQLLRVSSTTGDLLGDVGPDQELLIERSSRYRERLKVVNQALERMREGGFGRCVLCDDAIAQKRLEALPTARYCRDCQEQLERGEQPPPNEPVSNWSRSIVRCQ